jgi:hypothetical protein
MPHKLKAECSPQEWEAYKARRRESQSRYDRSPAGLAKRKRNRDRERVEDGDRVREQERRRYARAKERDANRIVIRNARKQRRRYWRRAKPRVVRDLMQRLHDLAPRHNGREEIIAAAALLVIEGELIEDAIKLATKKINGDHFSAKGNINFDGAYWL